MFRPRDRALVLIGTVFYPDPAVHIVSRINTNLVMPFDPVAIFIMSRDPNPFLPLRDPFSSRFPVTRGFMDHRGAPVDMLLVRPMGRYNGRENPMTEEVV